MHQCIEHNDLVRYTHKTEGLGACRQFRHGYSIIAVSYNAGPAEDKFAEWDNSSGDYHLTHLDNPTPITRKLKVDMPILFNPNSRLCHRSRTRVRQQLIPRSHPIPQTGKGQELWEDDRDQLSDFLSSSDSDSEHPLQFIRGSFNNGNGDDDAEGDPDIDVNSEKEDAATQNAEN